LELQPRQEELAVLFIGQAGAGKRIAILYTVMESWHRRKFDPYAYFEKGYKSPSAIFYRVLR